MVEKTLLKDKLSIEQVTYLADSIHANWSEFQKERFITQACEGLSDLSLKQRVSNIISALADVLPTDFEQTAIVLINTGKYLKRHLVEHKGWGEFIAWPITDYVAEYGQQHHETAMRVIEELTSLFTAEFALRPFLKTQFQQTYPYLVKWVQCEDEHLRRLASEATRPRLPWAEHWNKSSDSPEWVFLILEQLKDDKSVYVRKSVANHLNDISKNKPDLVLTLCREWQNDASPERHWIIKHALRTLIKQGHPQVFRLLGFSDRLSMEVADFQLDNTSVNVGESVLMSLSLLSTMADSQSFILDYRVKYILSNGKQGSKVYKWKEVQLGASQQIVLTKRHSFKPTSNRRYHSGKHTIEILVNGSVIGEVTFVLYV